MPKGGTIRLTLTGFFIVMMLNFRANQYSYSVSRLYSLDIPYPVYAKSSQYYDTIADTASLCVIVKDEGAYIDEWTDYNLALGFAEIFYYDNSENNNLISWKEKIRFADERLTIIHFPGLARQNEAYLECGKMSYEKNHTWAAFFDCDEFLVLKKHNNIVHLLHDHCKSGSLSINWYMFGSSGYTDYSPIPVTKRFQWRDPNPNILVKEVARLSDMNMLIKPPNPHYVQLRNGSRHDTNNITLSDHRHADGPVDVAVLHHYYTKSDSEFYFKGCVRGTVAHKEKSQVLSKCGLSVDNGTVFDDSAWRELKKRLPLYGLFDYTFLSSTDGKLLPLGEGVKK